MVDFPDVFWHFETVENTISRLFVKRLPINVLSVPNGLAFARNAGTEFHFLQQD